MCVTRARGSRSQGWGRGPALALEKLEGSEKLSSLDVAK